jgi:hypothetical protein
MEDFGTGDTVYGVDDIYEEITPGKGYKVLDVIESTFSSFKIVYIVNDSGYNFGYYEYRFSRRGPAKKYDPSQQGDKDDDI